MAELLIRAGHNDHSVIADLLAPGGAIRLHRPIDRLVADAHTATRRAELAQAANHAGVAFIVDPATPLLQVPVDPADTWVRRVTFGRAEKVDPATLGELELQRLAADVVECELELGATAIVPPYLFCQTPDDPAFSVTLRLLEVTARYMRREGINLPLLPVLCAQHRAFTPETAWPVGVDRFTARAADLGPQAVAVCLSPAGAATDSYAKVLRLFLAARRVKRTGLTTLAWRQGVFGPGLVAAGLDGYETGIGVHERSDLRAQLYQRRPRPSDAERSRPSQPMVFLEPLGRSVPRPTAETLLGDRGMRSRLLCDDEACCPDAVNSMLDRSRPHAVRSRARRLADLRDMPHRTWRLHQVAKEAKLAATLAKKGTEVLARAGESTKLSPTGQESLAQVAEYLRHIEDERLTA
jgi:hypothetical protein